MITRHLIGLMLLLAPVAACGHSGSAATSDAHQAGAIDASGSAIDANPPDGGTSVPPGGAIMGATTGMGSGNAHATPDLAGWQSFQQKTGTFAGCTKLFSPPDGYPNLWATWSGSLGETLANNNGGHPVMVLIVFNNIPTTAGFQTLLSSLPAGQRVGFIYQSEAENAGSGISGAAFVANEHTISVNLDAALAHMTANPVAGNAPSFYTRAKFPNINSAFMAYYQTSPGNTAYIPADGDVDAYGADLYHKGPATDALASSDPRFQGYVKAVHAKAGTNVFFAFPEYGVDGSNITDSQRASIIAGDYSYLTGTSSPGTKGLFLWNYWFEIGDSGQAYPFSAPSSTASEWHTID
jgi:hypothetical protein